MNHPDGLRGLTAGQRYRLLVESVTDSAIYMLDADGIVSSWNAGAQRLKGYSEAEVRGLHFSRFYPDGDVRAGMPARTLEVAAREGRFEAEGWRVRKDGSQFWAHVVVEPIRAASGKLIGYAKVTRDLTERRIAAEALRRSEDQFRLLVQGVSDYAIYMLDPQGIVTNWNVGAQRIKGYLPDEVIGSHFSRFYRQVERESGEPQRALATALRDGRFESEGWRVRKDGSEFWANVVIDPIRDAGGAIIGFAKVTRDATERRNASLALDRARDALFQAQKLEAIGRLTGGVAHDFNNLLMVVLSNLELARRRLPDDEKLRLFIDNAAKGAHRGVSLTQRMLAFARHQHLEPAAVDVAVLVLGMREMLERSLGPTIRVETKFPQDLNPVLVDANQLELAILNLAVNARDAMPEGGLLTISASGEAEPSQTGGQDRAEYVCICVADSGTGMSAATLERAMEPFFTTKGVGKGTGLGLAMVHGLATQSGGHFTLTSTEGRGTSALLRLPTAPRQSLSATFAQVSARSASKPEPLLVVVVDDDTLVLAGTCAMLEDLGHSVLPAQSAHKALELLDREPTANLLVTDQMMPGMTGTELLEIVRCEHPDIHVVLATGYGELPADLKTWAVRLAKPFDQAALAVAIQTAIDSRPGDAIQ